MLLICFHTMRNHTFCTDFSWKKPVRGRFYLSVGRSRSRALRGARLPLGFLLLTSVSFSARTSSNFLGRAARTNNFLCCGSSCPRKNNSLLLVVIVTGLLCLGHSGAIKLRQPPARKSDTGRGSRKHKPKHSAGEEERVSPLRSAESDLT